MPPIYDLVAYLLLYIGMTEQEETPTNTKNTEKPYKADIYDTYVAWRSIPAFMRLKSTPVTRDLKREDPSFGELLKIRTQTEFAEKYGVENSTLTNWNRLIEKKDVLSETRTWAMKLTSNLLLALYRKGMDTGNPQAIQLWFQVVNGWSPNKGKRVPSERVFTPATSVICSQVSAEEAVKNTLKEHRVSE